MTKVVAAVYVAIILGMTLLPIFGIEPNDPIIVQLTPFQTIVTAFDRGIRSRDFILLLGNIAMFVPVGILVPLLTGRRQLLPVFLVGLAFSGAIELTQLAISLLLGFGYRTANVDDVITNVAGAVLGYVAFVVYESWAHRSGDRPGPGLLDKAQE